MAEMVSSVNRKRGMTELGSQDYTASGEDQVCSNCWLCVSLVFLRPSHGESMGERRG